MIQPNANSASDETSAPSLQPPKIVRNDQAATATKNALTQSSVIACIQWFLDFDARVNIVRHPHINKLFLHVQERKEKRMAKENQVHEDDAPDFHFDSAEDRLAIGIFQALANNATELELHAWIADLLTALDDATKTNEAISETYDLSNNQNDSALARAAALPTEIEREIYLSACWLEVLCTAEARVLGWIYQDLYGRAFRPENF